MKKLFLLSKQDVKLASQEVLAFINEEFEILENCIISDTKFKNYGRLAYTRKVYELLFITYKKDLKSEMQSYAWQKIFKKDFCVRTFNNELDEKEFAGFIWNNLKNPKVNLKDSKTEIHIIKKRSKYLVCKLITKLNHTFEQRKSHKLPKLHPTTLHPKLARALVNLTGVPIGKTILDPFVGSGGILIEAALIGVKGIGYDIDDKSLEKAKDNIKHFKLKNVKLEKKDALTIKKNFDYLATDLPYGLNTNPTNIKKTYTKFLNILDKKLKNKAVIVFPDFVNYKKLINKTDLKIEAEFDYYLHKSLSKKIVLISKP